MTVHHGNCSFAPRRALSLAAKTVDMLAERMQSKVWPVGASAHSGTCETKSDHIPSRLVPSKMNAEAANPDWRIYETLL
jgi:hypothetical protein